MIEQPQPRLANKNQYLKEYQCKNLVGFMLHKYNPIVEHKINLPPTNNIRQLPRYYLDQTTSKIYLIKCQKQHNNNYLLEVLEIIGGSYNNLHAQNQGQRIQSEKQYNFYFNYQPEHLAILSDYAYFIGGRKIHIISLKNPHAQKNIIDLYYQRIQAICGFLQEQSSAALAIYYTDSKKKLHEKIVSPSTKNIWSDTLSSTIAMFKRFIPVQEMNFIKFRVLVPKVLGIIFHNVNEFSLINLGNFEIINHTKTKLNSWSLINQNQIKIIMKNLPKQKPTTDKISVLIGSSLFIQLFTIQIPLNENMVQHIKDYRMCEVLEDFVINWAQIKITSEIVICHDQQIIEDVQFVKDGFIMCGLRNAYASLPRYLYYSESNYYLFPYTILGEQTNIWQDYLENNNNQQNFNSYLDDQYESCFNILSKDTNRLLLSNRYNMEFICHIHDSAHITEFEKQRKINWKQTVYKWFQQYKFAKLIHFKGQFLILRSNSINVLLPIDVDHYNRQLIKFQKIYTHLIAKAQPNSEDIVDILSKVSNQMEQQIFINEQMFPNNHLLSSQNQQLSQIYDAIYIFLRNCFEDKYIARYNQQFVFKPYYINLLTNRLKDILNYICTIFTQYLMIFEVMNKKLHSVLHPIIAFYKFVLNFNHLKQYEHLYSDLLWLYIQTQMKPYLTNNIEKDICLLTKKLLQGLIPQNYEDDNFTIKNKQSNTFIKMLIKIYNDGFKQLIIPIVENFFVIMEEYNYMPCDPIIFKMIELIQNHKSKQYFAKYILNNFNNRSVIVKCINQWQAYQNGLQELIIICCPQSLEDNLLKITKHIQPNYQQIFIQILKKTTHLVTIPTFQQLQILLGTDHKTLNEKIESTIKKLQLLQSHKQLLQFHKNVLRIRCKQFEYAISHNSQFNQLINILKKCQTSLADYIIIFECLYDQQAVDEKQLLNSYFITCNGSIKILQKVPSTNWIDLLIQYFKTKRVIPSEGIKQIVYCLMDIAIDKNIQRDDCKLLRKLIEEFGKNQLSKHLTDSIYRLLQKYKRTSNQFKALFRYSHVNTKIEQFQDVAKKLYYRSATIEQDIINNHNY